MAEPESKTTSGPVPRDALGRVLPGHSLNPGGKPKKDRELARRVLALGPDAVERIKELMYSDDDKVALGACRAVLGLIFQNTAPLADDEDGTTPESLGMTKDELLRLATNDRGH